LLPQSGPPYATEGYNSQPRRANLPSLRLSPAGIRTDVDSHNQQSTRATHSTLSTLGHTPPCVQHVNTRHAELLACSHCSSTVPLEQLQVLFTFFSKFFSPFVHTTSSLSVSQEYLALDEIYHLFRAAIPNNPTREKPITY